MENTKGSITKYFLPSYFRIVGLVLIIVSIIVLVFATIVKAYYEFFPAAHQMFMFNKLSFVCGLSLIIFSKEKSENDEINKSRFNALVFSLAASVLILIVFEVINILNSQAPLYAVDFLIIEMCVYYIFYRMKK
jgi:hypothetical protein